MSNGGKVVVSPPPAAPVVKKVVLASALFGDADPFAADTSTLVAIGKNKSFVLEKEIGAGNFGWVFLAHQIGDKTGKKWALKIMKMKELTPDSYGMLKKEVAILKILPHSPYLLRYDDTFDADYKGVKSLVIQMEYIEGVGFQDFIKANKLRPRTIYRFLSKCLLGLSQLHEANIHHLDIKPDNIRVRTVNGIPHPVFIDFGFACTSFGIPITKVETKCSVVDQYSNSGSPVYTSPQRFKCLLDLGCASNDKIRKDNDLWSLGMSFWDCLNPSEFYNHVDELSGMGFSYSGNYTEKLKQHLFHSPQPPEGKGWNPPTEWVESWEKHGIYPAHPAGKVVERDENKKIRKSVEEIIKLLCGPVGESGRLTANALYSKTRVFGLYI